MVEMRWVDATEEEEAKMALACTPRHWPECGKEYFKLQFRYSVPSSGLPLMGEPPQSWSEWTDVPIEHAP